MTDSDIEKMITAERCKRDRTDGFQGCTRCKDTGFYLKSYSKEGHCRACELACFPERFYPCVHCRVPHDMQMNCLSCQGGCRSWLERLHYDSSDSEAAAQNNYEAMCKRSEWHEMASEMTNAGDHDGRYEYSRGWPGFYMGLDANGKGVWKKLPYLPKVGAGGICQEEPWYVPAWKSLAELSTLQWQPKEGSCPMCGNDSLLERCDTCNVAMCNILCAERSNHQCKGKLISWCN